MRPKVKVYIQEMVKWLRYRAEHGEEAAEVEADRLDCLWDEMDQDDINETNKIARDGISISDEALADVMERLIATEDNPREA